MATAISAQSVTSRKKGAMKRTILILLGWMLLSQGCSYGVGDDCLPPEEPVPIRMAIAEGKLSTRAPVTTIDASNLSNVGIYAVSEGSIAGQYPWTSTPFALNLYRAASAAASSLSTPNSIIHWEGNGSFSTVIIRARQPQAAAITSRLRATVSPLPIISR